MKGATACELYSTYNLENDVSQLLMRGTRRGKSRMQKIIFATGNAGKMKEIRMILADLGAEILSMKEAGISLDIVEDGSSYEANALIKARAVAACEEAQGAVVMADDSGLEVDQLNGEPGIYSARYLGRIPRTASRMQI